MNGREATARAMQVAEGEEASVLNSPAWLTGLSLRGRLRSHEPMSRHCTWRAGGAAERLFEPADLADLVSFLQAAPLAEPLTLIGFGSNLLVRDGGLPGTVILTAGVFGQLRWLDERRVEAGAGVACAKVARQAARRQLGGGEFLGGIPGTIGGALAMNAGAFGHEIWSLVEAVETLSRGGRVQRRPAAEFRANYRQLEGLNEEWFVSGTLRFDVDASTTATVRDLLARRNASQPLGLPSCGSVFKNPPGDFAGRLIEAAGCKGRRRGGAYVSPKHANFIINDGSASADDIEGLMWEVQQLVAAHSGQRLETEVRILGLPAADGVGA